MGANSKQAHDIVLTSMRRNDVASTSFRRHLPTRFLSRLRSRSETYVLPSGVVVVVVVGGGGGVNFCRVFAFRSFSQKTIRARAMKLGSCIYLEELSSILRSILNLDLLFTVHLLMSSFCV